MKQQDLYCDPRNPERCAETDRPHKKGGWFSVDLMKSGCPSCLIVGLVGLVIESIVRGIGALFRVVTGHRVASDRTSHG